MTTLARAKRKWKRPRRCADILREGKDEEELEEEEATRSHHKARRPQLTIHYSGNMEELFLHFYKEKDYECEIVVRDEAMKELRLKLDEAVVRILTFSVEGEECLVRRAQNAEADYAKFLPLFAEVKATFLHRDWMSHYSPGLQRAFNQMPRSQLVSNFVDGKHEGVGVDIRSLYPSLLSSVEMLPVFSSMSDFQPFVRGTEVDEHCFYIVESCSDEVEGYILLNRKLNLVSGWALLNCELPSWSYKVRAFIRPVSLEENTFPLVVKRVGEVLGDPLSNTGKFVLNSLIGLTGKRKAQNTAGKWTTDYEEARVRTADPRDIYAYAEGYLAISRSEEVLLENGFFPAQFLVYDRARIALLRLYRQLIQAGCVIYSVKTDCFVVDKLPDDFRMGRGSVVGRCRNAPVKPRVCSLARPCSTSDPPTHPGIGRGRWSRFGAGRGARAHHCAHARQPAPVRGQQPRAGRADQRRAQPRQGDDLWVSGMKWGGKRSTRP